MNKPVILTFIHYYLPGSKSGGPVRTVFNMTERLSDDFEFRIITADRDALDNKPYPKISINEWDKVGKAWVYYISSRNWSFLRMRSLISNLSYDFVYLNSFFNPRFTILPLIICKKYITDKRPIIIAPRGEFSTGALGIKKSKKAIYISIAKKLNLYQNLIWQASSDYEAEDIRRVMGSTARNIVIAPDLPSVNLDPKDFFLKKDSIKNNNALRIVFLSRISPTKNLDYALNVLFQINVPTIFDIYGLIEDNLYWHKCLKLINNLPEHVKVDYKGVVDNNDVIKILSQYDLFFLPTRGENYGHVIFEALSAGIPVLISNQTPWQDLEEKNVGWAYPLDQPEKFMKIIESIANHTEFERNIQRNNVLNYAKTVTNDQRSLDANKSLFMNLL